MLIDELPPTLNRRRYTAELRAASRRANAGEKFALILPLIAEDGSRSRCLVADAEAHRARERFRQGHRRPPPVRDVDYLLRELYEDVAIEGDETARAPYPW